MNFQCSKRIPNLGSASRIAVLCFAFGLSACAAEEEAAPTLHNPIEGRWLLPNGRDRVHIVPCGATIEAGFCGTFLPADTTAEDLMNSDLFEWGRSLDGAKVIQELMPRDEPGEYRGSYYLPDVGDTLRLDIRQMDHNQLAAVVYYGTDAGEVTEMAINSIFSPIKAVDVSWLAIRATIGKEVLSTEQIWLRDRGRNQ